MKEIILELESERYDVNNLSVEIINTIKMVPFKGEERLTEIESTQLTTIIKSEMLKLSDYYSYTMIMMLIS